MISGSAFSFSCRLRPGNDHLPSLSSFHITGNGNTPADSPTGGRSTPCDSPPSINSFDLDMPSSLSVLSSVDVTHSPSIKPSPRLTLRSLAPSSPSCFVCVDLAECQGIDVGGISPLLATATRSISFSDSSVSVRSAPGKEKSAASKVYPCSSVRFPPLFTAAQTFGCVYSHFRI